MLWIGFCLIGGGWLSQLGVHAHLGHGFVDFAGSSVVHMVGGLAGLMGILVLGPRIGKFRKDGTPKAIPGHNIPIAIVGTMILVFGWFGFNAGSTLNGGDLRLAVVATCIVFEYAVMYTFFRVQDRIQVIRVSPAAEVVGLDSAEMSVQAYTGETGDRAI